MTDHPVQADPSSITNTRPEVYLCQVDEQVSCGACCGLYNVNRLSRVALQERLENRTERFARTPRTETAIDRFRRHVEGWTPEERPFPQFHHCPFLGLVGRAHRRVGCLLHPETPGNDGRDFRGLSHYGAKACRSYFCPASRLLPVRYLRLLPRVIDDWYAYGLIVTEHALVGALFAALEQRLGRELRLNETDGSAEARTGLRRLLLLKMSWPHRRPDGPGLCHHPFDNGQYPRAHTRWPSSLRPCRHFQTAFRELDSVFGSESELRQAVDHLASLLGETARALGNRGLETKTRDRERMTAPR